MVAKTFIKDPDARLDYAVDLSDLANLGDSITDAVISVTSTLDSSVSLSCELIDITDIVVRFWVSGGVSGCRYQVQLRYTTVLGRSDDVVLGFVIINN